MNYLSDAEIEQLEKKQSSTKYLSDAEMDALVASSETQPSKKTSKMEDLEIGIKGLGHMGKDALDLLSGAAATHLGGDSDAIYSNMEARKKAFEEEVKAKGDQGTGGKIISGLTQLVPAVAAIPFVGPGPALGAFSGMSALSRGGSNVAAGADAWTQAVPQATFEGALDMTAAKFIPPGKGILQGMAYGAGGNVLAEGGQDILAHQLLPESAQAPYAPSLEKYIVSGATGALPGAVIGGLTPKGRTATPTPEVDPAVRPETTDVQKMRDQIAYSERTLESVNEDLVRLNRELDTSRSDSHTKHILDKITEKETEQFKLTQAIEKLSQHPEIASRIDAEGATRPDQPAPDTTPPMRGMNEPPPLDEVPSEYRGVAEEAMAEAQAAPSRYEFIQGVTPDEVHSNFLTQLRYYDSKGIPDDTKIDAMILARVERINDMKQRAKGLLPGQADKIYETIGRMEAENQVLDLIHGDPAGLKQVLADLDGADAAKLSPQDFMEVMHGIVEHGTLRNGLKGIVDNSSSAILRGVSSFLLSNKTIGKYVKMAYDPTIGFPALARQNDKVHILFRSEGTATTTNFVHEAIHAATSGMMMAVRAGYKLAPEVHKAIENINNLHTRLSGDLRLNFVNAIYSEMNLAKRNAKMTVDPDALRVEAEMLATEALKNDRELVAYGLSHDSVVRALNTIELAGEKSFAKQMYESIANMIGWNNKEVKTALQELMNNSQVLIEQSKGESFKQITGRDTTAEDYTREFRTPTGDIGLKSSNKYLQGMYDFAAAAGRRVFITPDNLANYYNHPLIRRVSELAKAADNHWTGVQNDIMTGNPSFSQFKAHWGGKLFSMSKALHERGLEYAINNTPVKAIGQVGRLMDVVIRDGTTWERAVADHLPGATEAQRNFAKSLDRSSSILLSRVNTMLEERGLPPVRDVGGYVIRNLIGRYYVDKAYNGEVFERKHFFSETEANAYAKQSMLSDRAIAASVIKKDPKANNDNITEVLNDIIEKSAAGVNAGQYSKAKLATIKAQASSVGGHKIHRGLVHNFMGGLADDAAYGKAFADSLVQGVGEYTNSGRLRQLAADTAQDMHGASSHQNKTMYPNAYKVAQYFLDNEMNRLDHNKFTESIAPMSNLANETINNLMFSVTGKHVKQDVITKTWQDITRVAYNLKLTAAPVTWLAQAMATMQSTRGVFKEGAGLIEGMSGISKGILRTLSKQYDEDAIKGLYHVSQNLDTFHKHTINDSTIGQMSKKTSLDEFRKWMLGEKFTEGSDSFSRIAAYNISYETLKAMGWRAGDVATYEKAAEMATENMIAMGKKHLPGFYKELGFVGTTQAPLRGYMHGAFSNLATDIKDLATNPTKANALALTANMMSILLMGGLLGAPLLADYEYLRQLLVKSGAIAYDALPSWTRVAEKMPNWASRGVISDITGVDMGASMRYNSIFKPFGEVSEASNLADLSLQIGTVTDLAAGGFNVAKDMLGNQTDEAARVNWNKILPRGPSKAIKEELYDYRDASVTGNRGDKLVDRGPTERAATLLGSSSNAESKARTARTELDLKKLDTNARKQKAVDLILSPNASDKDAGRSLIAKMHSNNDITAYEARQMLLGRVVDRNRTLEERAMSNKYGDVKSKANARNIRDLSDFIFRE